MSWKHAMFVAMFNASDNESIIIRGAAIYTNN